VNLLHNAIKFTESGKVALRIEQDAADSRPGALSFAVSDTGVGIPADKLDTIFERFTQVDSSYTRREGGTGLGLAIAKHLVELLGGRIRVSSTLGAGSRFSFSVRFGLRGADDLDLQKTLPSIDLASVTGRSLRILLAEDSSDNRLLIQAFLKDSRCRIDVAQNGAQAVDAVRGRRYDVVLMDVEMPVMDGYTATRAIRLWETETGRAPTPIIALTAYARKEDEQRSLAAGCTAHLSKPVRKPQLTAAIARYARPAEKPLEKREPREDRIVLQVSRDLEDLVPSFLESRGREISDMRNALLRGDFDTIRRHGHTMRGSGGGFGFDEISVIGEALETAAAASNVPVIQKRLEELSTYLQRVEVEFVDEASR
jgi:CheY-like chemotaxis protein/HPt (histidine-containing phosphotransfer) domain-containing protein